MNACTKLFDRQKHLWILVSVGVPGVNPMDAEGPGKLDCKPDSNSLGW